MQNTKMSDITLIEEHRSADLPDPDALRRARMLPPAVETYDIIFDVLCTADNEEVIQKISTHLGFQLGYKDQIDAVQMGADLFSILAPTTSLFNFVINPNNKRKITIRPGKECTYTGIPKSLAVPTFHPHIWEKNSDKERGSIFLGGPMSHHNEQLPLDSFNKLNKVGLRLDNYVLDNERDPYLDKHPQLGEAIRTVFSTFRDKKFYLTWKSDTAIRQYVDGWLINPQGGDRRKAEINFSKGQVIKDPTWLKLAATAAAGHDKWTYEKRLEWFDEHYPDFPEAELLDIECAEDPILFRKYVRTYSEWLENPEKESNVPASGDVTSSGPQIYAALAGCRETAGRCNLIFTGLCEDSYTHAIDRMNEILPPEERVTNRKNFKKAMVAAIYGSKKAPRDFLSEAQNQIFPQVMVELFPGIERLRKLITGCWNPTAVSHKWTMPDDVVCDIPVRINVDYTITLDHLNDLEYKYRCKQNMPSHRNTPLAPRIIHSIDAYIARQVVLRADFDVIHVHDRFFALPDNIPKVQQLYREILAEIAQSNLLSDILSEITGRYVEVKKDSTDLHVDILASVYAVA